jgi:hypothetical protein
MSKLEDVSLAYRKKLIAKNEFDNNDQYNIGHADALSTGDEQGKGEVNGQIGSATDIKQRDKLITKNKFNKNREYNDATA